MLGGGSMDYGIVLPNGWVSPGVNAAKSHQACARRRLTQSEAPTDIERCESGSERP